MIGQEGYLYYLTRYEDIDVVLPGKKLFIPLCTEEFDSLENTIEALYELKVTQTKLKISRKMERSKTNVQQIELFEGIQQRAE